MTRLTNERLAEIRGRDEMRSWDCTLDDRHDLLAHLDAAEEEHATLRAAGDEMTPPRMTPAQLAKIQWRAGVLEHDLAGSGYYRDAHENNVNVAALIEELDAVTRERDEAQEKLEGTRNWLSRVEGELTKMTAQLTGPQ